MDRAATDLAMKFVLPNNTPVFAQCLLQIAKGDALMSDFTHSNFYRTSNFFEISDFEFGLSLKEDDDSGKGHRMLDSNRQNIAGAFARWRSALRGEIEDIRYPVEFDKFSFSRSIDRASPIFFEKCCNSTTFDSATLVKRISPGGVDRPPVGYLRIDFGKVLITGITWDDGDVVKEKCEFICREMQIRYRSQQADGTIGAQGEQQVKWKQEMSV
jgi:type VI protein secretion system component Hcp